jgi:hypothetical protein
MSSIIRFRKGVISGASLGVVKSSGRAKRLLPKHALESAEAQIDTIDRTGPTGHD